jgi:hypothetical protein
MKLKIALLALLLLPLCGCVSMSKLAEQLKQDPATVDISVSTIYGNFVFHRAFPVGVTNQQQPTITVPLQMRIESAPTK